MCRSNMVPDGTARGRPPRGSAAGIAAGARAEKMARITRERVVEPSAMHGREVNQLGEAETRNSPTQLLVELSKCPQ